jgi:1,4-dihydroxy-2-naphthoyl-CoA hydrolase
MLDQIEGTQRTGEIRFFIEERSQDHVVTKGMLNPLGTVHAGAMLWLADVTATVLALQKVELGPQGQGFPLAIDLHTSLLGNQRDGEIKAEARFVRSGKRVTVVRTRVTGNDGRLLAEVTTTHIPAV